MTPPPECGCRVMEYEDYPHWKSKYFINYCPLHQAAGYLFKFIEDFKEASLSDLNHFKTLADAHMFIVEFLEIAEAILTKIRKE